MCPHRAKARFNVPAGTGLVYNDLRRSPQALSTSTFPSIRDQTRPSISTTFDPGNHPNRPLAPHTFHGIARLDERLGWNMQVPGFAAVVGYLGDTPVGYAYGCTLQPGTRWWNSLRIAVPQDTAMETGVRTFALSERVVTKQVRGTGAGRLIHGGLLRDRTEERVTLLVERDHPTVRALYQAWGYTWFGEVLPFPDAPMYDAMILLLDA